MTRKKGIAFLCILALLSCSGCQIEKTEASGDGQKAGVYKAGSRSEVDYEELSEALLGMTLEECKKAGGTMKEEKGWDFLEIKKMTNFKLCKINLMKKIRK